MQNLEILIANLNNLGTTITTDPIASAIAAALISALLVFLLTSIPLRIGKRKMLRLKEEMERKYKSVQETLSLKTEQIATMEQTCEEQKGALANAHAQIAQLEESAKKTPILEEKIEQQLRQIEALTETIAGEIDSGSVAGQDAETGFAMESAEPTNKEALIDHLGARLYQQLSSLHQQIADQSQLIVDLQSELDKKRESLAKQLIAKSQQIPKIAKSRFDERVVEPIHMRVDGFKQSVQAIPNQTRSKFDQLIIDPVYRRVNEIQNGLQQLPGQASSQLNKVALDPLNAFIQEINLAVHNASAFSHEKFNTLITQKLQNLVAEFKMSGRSLSRETRENFDRLIVRPLEKLLTEIKRLVTGLPDQSGDKLNQHVLRPTMQKLHSISESGKEASMKGIKNAGNWIVDSIATRDTAPAAAT